MTDLIETVARMREERVRRERNDLLAALTNIRDTIESCYIAIGWVPLDAEEMESIASMANTAIAKVEGES